jgi:arylsulfatase A-like enzyme
MGQHADRETRVTQRGRRERRAAGRIALLIAACLLAATGCGGSEPEKRGRVLLIGIDGTSPLLVGPMLEQGRLPNLASIAEAGISGPLRSEHPLFSPRIWNTIATGRKPIDHGIGGFVIDNKAEHKKLYESSDRKVPALWNILSDAGYSVAVVNWWTTYPPEKINGVMVSDHFFPEQISMIKRTFEDEHSDTAALVHPVDFQTQATELLAPREDLVMTGNPFESDLVLPHWLNTEALTNQYETDKQIAQVARGIEEAFHPDVMMVMLPGIDRVSHWLWGMLEPPVKYPEPLRPTDEEREGGAEALRRYYAFTDELIGRLLEGYGPDDLVIVMSDHGFEAGVSMMLLTGGHESNDSLNGVLFARGAGIGAGGKARGANVYHVTPSVLAWLGVPVGVGMARPPEFLGVDAPPEARLYDGMVVERVEVTGSHNEEEIVEHLRALGYLEEGVEPPTEEKPADPAPEVKSEP